MFTRRILLKQGGCAALASAVPLLFRTARAQSVTFNYYISPTGSDSNPGTLASPWAITSLVPGNSNQPLVAGKSVGLIQGTYNVYSLCQAGAWSMPALQIPGGSAGSPTYIASCNADGAYTPLAAILTAANPDGGGYPTTQCPIIGQSPYTASLGYVTLDGLVVTNSYQYGIEFYGSSNGPGRTNNEGGTLGVTIRNCQVYNIGGEENNNPGCILFYLQTGAVVHNCLLYGVQPSAGQDAAAIFSFNSHGNLYEYNTIYNCNCGIYDKNAGNGGHTYRYNYIEIAGLYPLYALCDCSGGGTGDVVTVYNNIFVAPQAWNSADGGNNPSSQGLVFYNNTCYYGGGGFNSGGVYYAARGSTVSPAANVSFYNNIIYSVGTPGYLGLISFCSGSVVLCDYNCYQPLTASSGLLGLSSLVALATPALQTLSAWQSATGMDAHSIAANPDFTGPASLSPSSYQLQSSSPCHNMGRVGGTAAGAATDVGAWGGGATQIGCNFGPVPNAPVLSIG